MTGSERTRSVVWAGQVIPYDLTVEDRRDLAVTVHPDLRVTVRAPITKPLELIEQRINAKRVWIARQVRELEQYLPLPTPRRFISGETHWYLGRQYRLKLGRGVPTVTCFAGRLTVTVPQPEDIGAVRETFDRWYSKRAKAVFSERLEVVQRTVRELRVLRPTLRIRLMKQRWGSFAASGAITLNTDLIRVPKGCIDYVVVHELCHFFEPRHSRRFFRLLETFMPDWQDRRRRLNLAKW
jgi:predicted metal-dependent hydrolase